MLQWRQIQAIAARLTGHETQPVPLPQLDEAKVGPGRCGRRAG